mgnify:CR=1
MNAAGLYLATQLSRIETESALPKAPVIGGRGESGRAPVKAVRSVTARALRSAADRLAPAQRSTCN